MKLTHENQWQYSTKISTACDGVGATNVGFGKRYKVTKFVVASSFSQSLTLV